MVVTGERQQVGNRAATDAVVARLQVAGLGGARVWEDPTGEWYFVCGVAELWGRVAPDSVFELYLDRHKARAVVETLPAASADEASARFCEGILPAVRAAFDPAAAELPDVRRPSLCLPGAGAEGGRWDVFTGALHLEARDPVALNDCYRATFPLGLAREPVFAALAAESDRLHWVSLSGRREPGLAARYEAIIDNAPSDLARRLLEAFEWPDAPDSALAFHQFFVLRPPDSRP